MNGVGFDLPVTDWFEMKVPKTKIDPQFIESAINSDSFPTSRPSSKPIWMGHTPLVSKFSVNKKGKQKRHDKANDAPEG